MALTLFGFPVSIELTALQLIIFFASIENIFCKYTFLFWKYTNKVYICVVTTSKMKTAIIQLSDLQLVDIIGDASRLELTDESFKQLLSKLEYTGSEINKAYEYENDNGVHDYGMIVQKTIKLLTIWNGQKYVDVEFTEEQLEKLAELVYTPWT